MVVLPEKRRKHHYLSVLSFCCHNWLDNLLYLQICLALIIFSCNFGKCFASNTKLQYKDHEKAAYIKAGYFQAAMLQQAYVQLVAPDVQLQLQHLADEIAVANGADMTFRVHIINDNYLSTFSMGSGDIFIPIAYLDMVANRDEIAFGLAREIAMQHRLLHLRDMEEDYNENRRNQTISFFSSLVIGSAVNTAFNHIFVLPIHKKIMEELIDTKSVSPYMSIELQRFIILQKNLEYRQMSKNVGTILGILLGWAPDMITNETLKLVTHMINISNEDADASRRKLKNELGITYMGIAGFDPAAGNAVINKIEEWWNNIESSK